MLSKHIASGAMLAVILGAASAAAWQHTQGPAEAAVTQVETALPIPQESAGGESEQYPAERAATAPNRVVESAGFPVIPDAEPAAPEVIPTPIVTVDGRPLGQDTVPVEPAVAADENIDTPSEEAPAAAPENDVQVAVSAPPLPQPRPEGLAVRPAEPVAQVPPPSQPNGEFMSAEERGSLITLPGDPAGGPTQDGLVQIVGPSGQTIWVYEDQLQANDSRVMFERLPPNNPFGFIYE